MKTAPWIIISIALIAILSWRECTRPEAGVEYVYTHTTDTIVDSIARPYPVVKIVKEDSIIHDTTYLYREIDTAAILADYFAERHYNNQTLIDDSLLLVSINAVVTQNRLQWVQPTVKIRQPLTIHHHITMPVQKNEQHWGLAAGGFGYNSPAVFDAGPALKVRYHHLEFGYGRGLLNQTNLFTLFYTF